MTETTTTDAEAEAETTAVASQEARAVQPQFYTTPEPLSAERHARLGLKDDANYGFAREATSVMVTPGEFPLAARTYPVVFTDSVQPMPVAVLGARPSENLFVTDGQWEERAYIPSFVRRFPFAFLQSDDGERLVLCIDTSADMVSVDGPRKFFDGSEPSEVTKTALEFCTAFQQQHNASRILGETLSRMDLLVKRQAELKVGEETQLAVRDFLVVDEEKLNALSDEDFLELRKGGLLPSIYFHLASLANFRDLAARCAEQPTRQA